MVFHFFSYVAQDRRTSGIATFQIKVKIGNHSRNTNTKRFASSETPSI
jgi:hypothetical protein